MDIAPDIDLIGLALEGMGLIEILITPGDGDVFMSSPQGDVWWDATSRTCVIEDDAEQEVATTSCPSGMHPDTFIAAVIAAVETADQHGIPRVELAPRGAHSLHNLGWHLQNHAYDNRVCYAIQDVRTQDPARYMRWCRDTD